jgi:outer membrane protein TolC
MKSVYLIPLGVFFGFVFTTKSTNAQTLDLASCMKMADTANLQVRNAQLDIEFNEKQRGAYLAARLPQLNFTADYMYNAKIPGQVIPAELFGGPAGTFATVQFGVPIVLSNKVQLTQVLFNSQVNYGLAALAVNSEIVETQKQMTLQDVRYQVANTYFLIQGIIKQLEFIDSNLVNTKALIKNMESMVQQGVVIQTEADKLKINELTLANTKASLLATKDQLESLMKIYIGYPKDANISFEADKLVENSILVDQSETNFLALKMIDSQKKMNEEEKKGIKMGYLPNLSFYAAYNYNVNIKPEDNFRKGIDGAFLGLRLDWNLFDGLEKYHKAKMNVLNKEKIENQYELLNQQLEMAVDNNRKQIEVKAGALSITKEQLQLAESIHKNAVLKFKQGMNSSNDLILAENGLQQAQTNVVASYIQLRQAELEYLKSIGNIK